MRNDERERRARSFGQVAELYDRWRPGYPDALYDDVLSLAPAGRVLESGAGTGRATLGLAQRGASVLAIEPDPAMAAVARRRTQGWSVEVQESAFEDCSVAAAAYDLVVAAQSWHWVDPQRGAAVAARALRKGGSLCLWWNRPRDLSGPTWDAIDDAYAEYAPELDRRAASRLQPDTEEQAAPAAGFTPWASRTYNWTKSYDAESYTGLMRTQSNHVLLQPDQREKLLAAIHTAITDTGEGCLVYPYRTLLLTAGVRQ
ncbi:class I SAM-dependent methyltransferase [Rhodococcus sp. NPDC127530]|uniref:class I SAM-dependent methyltransferase n=1 Tax=unclassified Rhodococcus (in: high G+C Gram-positive bacteria) TaxID=192944 RepID=UPI0036396E47